MNNWKLNYAIDLNRPGRVAPVLLPGTFVAGDDCAHEWNVAVYDDGEPVNLLGYSVVAYINRFDGKSVVVTGSVRSNIATVTLSEECYAVNGLCTGILRIAKAGGERVTISIIRFAVGLPVSDEVVAPGNLLPSLDELLAQIEAMEAATAAANELTERIYGTADNGVLMNVSWALGTVLSATGAVSSSTVRIRTPALDVDDVVLLPDVGIKVALYYYDSNKDYIADATVTLAEQMLDVHALAPGGAEYFRVVAATVDDQDLTDRVDEIGRRVKVLQSNVGYVDTLIYQSRNKTVSSPRVPCKYTGNVDNLTQLMSLPNEMWVVLNGSTLQGLLDDTFIWALSENSTYTLSRRDLSSSVTTFDIRRINGLDSYYGYNTASDPALKWVNLTLSAVVSESISELEGKLSSEINALNASLNASVNALYSQDVSMQNQTRDWIYVLADRGVAIDVLWELGTVLSATGAESSSTTTRIRTSEMDVDNIVLLPESGIKLALYYYGSDGAYFADATVTLAEQMLDVHALAPDGAEYFRVVAATADNEDLTDRVDEIAGRVKVLLSNRGAMDVLANDVATLAADVDAQCVDSKNLFDPVDGDIRSLYPNLSTDLIASSSLTKSVVLPCAPGETFYISRKNSGTRFQVGFTADNPAKGVAVLAGNNILNTGKPEIAVTAPDGANYMLVWYYHETYDTDGYAPAIEELQITQTDHKLEYAPYGRLVGVGEQNLSDALHEVIWANTDMGDTVTRHAGLEHRALFSGEPAAIRWELGAILSSTGAATSASNRMRSVEYLPVGDVAFFADEGVKIAFFYYDADMTYLTGTAVKFGEVNWLDVGANAPDGAAYFRVTIAASDDSDLSGLRGTFPSRVRIFVSGDVGDAFTRTGTLAVQREHLLYTEFEWIPGWWNPTGGYYDTEHMHSQMIPVEAGRAYYLGYRIADQGCTGAFFDGLGNWLAPLLPDDISAYTYKLPDGSGKFTDYAELYTFTAPQGARFFSYNLSTGEARQYRQFVATMPVLALENTGNYRFDDDWPGYQAHKDKHLCVIGASGVMIDRFYREVPKGSGTWQYIVGFQEYLVPWYASVESYGFSSGSWAKSDASANISIYNGIITNGVDLSGYDEFLLIPSTSGVTADTIGEIDSTDVDTYMGGLNAMLDKIHAESPYAKVYLANALRKGSYYTSESQRAKIDRINEQLAAIAAAKSLQLIDLAGGCGINAYNQDGMTYDGTHLNQQGSMRQGLFLRREMIGF